MIFIRTVGSIEAAAVTEELTPLTMKGGSKTDPKSSFTSQVRLSFIFVLHD